MEPKEQRKVDDFIVYGMCAARQAHRGLRLAAEDHEDQMRDGRADRLGHRRHRGHRRRRALTLHERGPRRVSPFFIPGRLINLASGYVSIAYRAEGSEPRGGHRMLDRRARYRRCRPSDRARRCRRDGRGRHRVAGEPPLRMAGFAACRALSTSFNDDARPRPRVPTTRIATAS